MFIGEDRWLLSDAEVVLSQMKTPNYVDINTMVPATGTSLGKIDSLIGEDFILRAYTDIASKRDLEEGQEDNLLFKGKLANISATGKQSYEGIAYDPSQEPLSEETGGNNGSVLNQKITIGIPYYGADVTYTLNNGTEYEARTIRAKLLAERIVDKLPGDFDTDIQLQEDGRRVTGPGGEFTGAYNPNLTFETTQPTIGKALEKIREECRSEWWFDKEGTLHIGVPDATAHELRYITDASDGVTTPPYQSVRVIGSGIASEEGFARTNMRSEDRIVVERTIGERPGGGLAPAIPENEGDLSEPVFTYRNSEISTRSQAVNTADQLIDDLMKQQKEGKVTVTGFPEVMPFDAIIMPHARAGSGAPNYQANMPMGGSRYSVYKVVHRLNPDDGFKTIIHVAGLVGASRVQIPAKDSPELPGREKAELLKTQTGLGLR